MSKVVEHWDDYMLPPEVVQAREEAATLVVLHPFFLRGQEEQGITIVEIRDFLVAFLMEQETYKLCGDCPVTKRAREHAVELGLRSTVRADTDNAGCCSKGSSTCAFFVKDQGCGKRNTFCLGFTCGDLSSWLDDRGVWHLFQTWVGLFRGLESVYSTNNKPDHTTYRIVDEPKWHCIPIPTRGDQCMPVINIKQAPPGWEQNPNYVYIGRGGKGLSGKWGNPFSHRPGTLAKFRVSSRELAVSKHRQWLLGNAALMAQLGELKGKILVCFCMPEACHGTALSQLAELSDCLTCLSIIQDGGFGPRHEGSKGCESGSLASGGKNSHCSCDTCF